MFYAVLKNNIYKENMPVSGKFIQQSTILNSNDVLEKVSHAVRKASSILLKV